jgi:hypothetical protein
MNKLALATALLALSTFAYGQAPKVEPPKIAVPPAKHEAVKPPPPSAQDLQHSTQNYLASMAPMMAQMNAVMLEGFMVEIAKPETAERLATFKKNFYDSLRKKGFTHKEALDIVIATPLPTPTAPK